MEGQEGPPRRFWLCQARPHAIAGGGNPGRVPHRGDGHGPTRFWQPNTACHPLPSDAPVWKAFARRVGSNQTAPIEVVLRDVEEVQMFLIANADEDWVLKETQLIPYALIKLQCAGLYTKAIELWQRRGVKDRQSWADFRQFIIE